MKFYKIFVYYTLFFTFLYGERFYVYSHHSSRVSRYSPSGYMGDVSDIYLSGDYKVLTIDGSPSLRFRYLPSKEKGWVGLCFQNPAGNWGDVKGGYDLRGSTSIVFYAKGAKGGETISVVGIGGNKGKYPDSDEFHSGPLKLTNKWKKYTINISHLDLKYISCGFFLVLKREDNPAGTVVYLGDIYYEGKKIIANRYLDDIIPPEVEIKISSLEHILNPEEKNNISFSIRCYDNRLIKEWEVTIKNEVGVEIKNFSGKTAVEQLIVWDGIDDVYKKLVPEGKYRICLSAKDYAGNLSQDIREINVVYHKPVPIPVKEKEIIKVPEIVEVSKDIKVMEEEKAVRVTLTSRVLFESGKYNLLPESRKILMEVISLLKNYPENRIVIEGHTDSVGAEDYNMRLSYNRANEVKKFFIENGIDEKRVEVKGYGETRPVASNKTPEGRTLNRRVEILIMK